LYIEDEVEGVESLSLPLRKFNNLRDPTLETWAIDFHRYEFWVGGLGGPCLFDGHWHSRHSFEALRELLRYRFFLRRNQLRYGAIMADQYRSPKETI
jgi:hypothetical protein